MTLLLFNIKTKDNWKLAAMVTLLYYPFLLYVDLPVYLDGGETWKAMAIHELINVAVVVVFLFIWITGADVMFEILTRYIGDDFLHRLRLFPMIVLVGIAFGFSFTFILAAGRTLDFIDETIISMSGLRLLVSFPKTATEQFFQLFKRANIGLFFLLMLSAFYLIANRRAGLKLNELILRSERIEKEKSLAQLEVLRNQVNPHFLFNSLSILTTLVHDNPSLSEKFISELSKFYRYSLDEGKNNKVMVQTELSFVRSYLFLLSLRFGEKLKCCIEIPVNEYAQAKIAPFSLQLLLENAVNHNQMSDSRPLQVSIKIVDDYIVVQNSIHEKVQRINSTKAGLKNIIDRYRLLTDKPVFVESTADMFVVRIPLLA
jgi:two-component system LytT family sensor kinase